MSSVKVVVLSPSSALVHYRTERLREIAAKDRRELKRIVTVSHAARVEAGVEKPATKKQPKIKRETAKADRRATKATKHDTQTAKKLARASKKWQQYEDEEGEFDHEDEEQSQSEETEDTKEEQKEEDDAEPEEERDGLQVEEILDKRVSKKGPTKGRVQYRVQWSGGVCAGKPRKPQWVAGDDLLGNAHITSIQEYEHRTETERAKAEEEKRKKVNAQTVDKIYERLRQENPQMTSQNARNALWQRAQTEFAQLPLAPRRQK